MSQSESPRPLRYGNVVCLLTGHDAEWSRRHASGEPPEDQSLQKAFERVFDEVDRITGRYREGLNKNAEKTLMLDDVADMPTVPDHFYSPINYLPIGHADALTLTLFDDLDPIHSLTAQCSTTIEEVAVGFSPLVESIWKDDQHGNPTPFRNNIVDIEDLFKQRASLPPLLVFCRLKLSPVSLLGQSLYAQAATFRSIASDCERVLNRLSERAREGELTKFEIDCDRDIRPTRISLLDLQGQEEIGVLIATRNYSIAGAILSRIQGTTIENIINFDPQLRQRLKDSDWIKNAVSLLKDIKGAEPIPETPAALVKDIVNSHALRWTRSTLALQPDKFTSANPGIFGFVDLISNANIAVGHQTTVEEALRKTAGSASPRKSDLKTSDYWAQLMGPADLVIHQYDLKQDTCRLIRTEDAIKQVREFLENGVNPTTGQHKNMRHLVGFSSVATVPTPKDENFQRPLHTHCPLLQTILPVIRWRMMDGAQTYRKGTDAGPFDPNAIEPRQRLRPNRQAPANSPLCCYTLRTKPRSYLAPAALIRTAQYLYQNYATLLSNPYVFDSVIDLYDCFATLHKVLVEHLPERYARDPLPDDLRAHGGGRKAVERKFPQQIPGEIVIHLSRYFSAIHRALEHRLYHAFPDDAQRETDVDFRGGLNQLISGADALVKGAVGLVKRYAFSEPRPKPEDDNFDTIGIINRIDFEPDIVAVLFELGIEDKARLAIIRSDVPHLCVVASYLDFIHEVGHIGYAERRLHRKDTDQKQTPLAPIVPIGSSADDSLAEIYTNILATLLVCRETPDLLCKHLALTFALSNRHGIKVSERFMVITDYVFRLFVVHFAVDKLKEIAKAKANSWFDITPHEVGLLFPKELRETLVEPFHRFFTEYVRFCWDAYEFPKEKISSYITELFDSNWAKIQVGLAPVVSDVLAFFQRYVRSVLAMGNCPKLHDSPLFSQMTDFEDKLERWIDVNDEVLRKEKRESSHAGIPTAYAGIDK